MDLGPRAQAEPAVRGRSPVPAVLVAEVGTVNEQGGAAALRWLTFLTLASASLEGYLVVLHPNASKVLPGLLFLAWMGHLVWVGRPPRFTLQSWLAGALIVTVLLASAVNVANPAVWTYAARWLPFLLITICLIDLFTSVVDIGLGISAIIIGALISSLGALYSFLIQQDPRATGPLPDSNDLAYVLAAALPLVVSAPPRFLAPPWVRLPVVLILVAGAAATLSRGVLSATLVYVVWLLARRIVSPRALAGTLALVLLGVALVWVVPAPAVEDALAQKGFVAGENVATRQLRWAAAGRLLVESPLLGVGPGGAAENYVAASHNAELVEKKPPTHNMYLEVGAELGLVGLALFSAMIFSSVAATERETTGRARDQAFAIQGSLIMIIVASIFLSEEYYMSLWAAISLASALSCASSEPKPAARSRVMIEPRHPA